MREVIHKEFTMGLIHDKYSDNAKRILFLASRQGLMVQ